MYETLVADFDFPVLKTQEELQEERDLAASSVIPYYIYSENIASERADAVRQGSGRTVFSGSFFIHFAHGRS